MSNNPPVLIKETASYWVSHVIDPVTQDNEIHIKSKTAGGYFARHRKYNLLDEDGRVISSEKITFDVAEFILANFELKGDTESFNIRASDLRGREISLKKAPIVRPQDVRHADTVEEKSFTATGAKMQAHWPIVKKFSETGYGSIIRATMTNHQVCSSHCQYCSTILRNRKDSVSIEEAKEFIGKLYFTQAEFNKKNFAVYNNLYRAQTGSDIRLRGLILSGGGQPNLWTHFEEFVRWLGTLDIDLGLITNGFPPKIDEAIYRFFKWIRISITPEDASPHYKNGRFDRQYLPKIIINNPEMTVGLSYVVGPWTDDGILQRIHKIIEENGFDYCRLLTDCNLTRNSQLLAHQNLAERLFKLGYIDREGKPLTKMFHQLKYHGTREEAEQLWDQGQCFLQVYNVFWDTTGHEERGVSYCYPCDSVTVLAEETTDGHISVSARKFNSQKWGTYNNREVEKLFTEPVKAFFDPRKLCSSCLFMKNNWMVKDMAQRKDYSTIAVTPDIRHLNFP